MVPRLAGEQRLVQVHDRCIVPLGHERAVQHLHPIAASRLDQPTAQQRIDRPLGLVGPTGREQLGRIRRWRQPPELTTARTHQLEHLLEVLELLAGESRERDCEVRMIGIAEHQPDRRRRRLLLAVRVVVQDLGQVRERSRAPASFGPCVQVEHRGPSIDRAGRAMLGWMRVAPVLLLAGCVWRQPQGHLDYAIPVLPASSTGGATIVSAHFSRDGARDHVPADTIVVVFDREIDATSLVGGAFMIVLSDGSRLRAEQAVLAPASESDENRTVTLTGDFGEPGGRVPTDVVVIDRIWDEAGGPLLGAAGKVSAYEEGPRIVAVRGAIASSASCPGASQVVRTFWSDEILDVAADDLAQIDIELADGRTVHPLGFDDTRTDGSDTSDDNVLDFCVGEDAAARVVRVAAGSFRGPAGGRTGPILATVDPLVEAVSPARLKAAPERGTLDRG